MFKKGDNIIILSTNRKAVIDKVINDISSLVSGRIYLLRGWSYLYYRDDELSFDKEYIRDIKISKLIKEAR